MLFVWEDILAKLIGSENLPIQSFYVNPQSVNPQNISLCNLYGLTSLNNKLTCYKTPANSSCIDLFLRNCTKYFQSITVIETRQSHFHKIVVTTMKTNFYKLEPKVAQYRNYKNFTNELFRENLVNQLSNTEIKANDRGFDKFFKICGEVLEKIY